MGQGDSIALPQNSTVFGSWKVCIWRAELPVNRLSHYRPPGLPLEVNPAVQQATGHDELVYLGGAAADAGVAQDVVPVGDG
jgi:hypothetical protein